MTFSFSTDCTKQSEFFMQQEGTSLPDGFILLPTPVAPSCEPLQCCSSEWSFVQAGICESSSLPRPFLHYFTHPPESRWIRPTFHWCIMRWEDSPLPHKEKPFYFCRNVNRRTEFSYKYNTFSLLNQYQCKLYQQLFMQSKQNCTVSQTKAVWCLWGKRPPLHLVFHTADATSFSCLFIFALLFTSALSVTAGLSQFILPEEVGQNCISTWD